MNILRNLALSSIATLALYSCSAPAHVGKPVLVPTIENMSYASLEQRAQQQPQQTTPVEKVTPRAQITIHDKSSSHTQKKPFFQRASSSVKPAFLHYSIRDNNQYIHFQDDWAIGMKCYIKAGSDIYRLPKGRRTEAGHAFFIDPTVVSEHGHLLFFAIDIDGNASQYVPAYSITGYQNEKYHSWRDGNHGYSSAPKFSNIVDYDGYSHIRFLDGLADDMQGYVMTGNNIWKLIEVSGNEQEKYFLITDDVVKNNSKLTFFAIDRDGNKSPSKIFNCEDGNLREVSNRRRY